MILKYKLIFLLTMMLTISSVAIIFAQSRQNQIQLKISGLNFSSYERVKNHVEFEVALSFPIANRLMLRPEIGYYQYKHYWNYRSLEYRGTTYTTRNGQLWRDYSLMPTILIQPLQHLYFGTGMGIAAVYVKRILYTNWRSFWIDQNDNVIEVGKETYDKTKICLAASINTGWEQPIWRNFSIFIEGKYKLILAGSDLTGTSDSNVMIFSVFMGSSIRF